jgi:3-deoxy-D-manno-octulosonic acid kinase
MPLSIKSKIRPPLLVGSLQEPDNVYLIDFDNSYFRVSTKSRAKSWRLANLARLKRSLLKFKKNVEDFHFSDANWSALLGGYK